MRAALVLIACALALAGCGQAASTATTSRASPSGAVGSTLEVSDTSGTKLDVTVEQLIQPATGANKYSQPSAGKSFVGVKLRIKNIGKASYQNNANNETTITVSGGKALVADYNPITGCGNFDNGQVSLSVGGAKTGCVTFQVSSGQKVAAVRYANTVFPGTTAEWRVP
jgi:Domain of unknown function (DUF4352)